jgi:amino acid adenylation domain-containing protein
MNTPPLHWRFERSAAQFPDSIAVVEPGRARISYRELEALTGRARDRFSSIGATRGQRVGMYLNKSIDSVATMYGILRTGAAYVPVDPGAPPERNAYILANCGVVAVVVDRQFVEPLQRHLAGLDAHPVVIVIDGEPGGAGLAEALDDFDSQGTVPQVPSIAEVEPDDLAYILYTSGSTGRPKGVMLSHENAVTFVDWCSETFEPLPSDRFSSHAPFHFDLSVLDVHVCFKHGSTLVLVSEDAGKDALRLGNLIATERITIWYSAPSILSLLTQFGNLPALDLSALRHVLFAGEVFPVKHLRALCEQLPGRRFFNLYGPTETNVCTFYEVIPPVPPDRTTPYPIGKTCSHLRSRVVDEHGHDVPSGAEGELCITGPGVMQGYWALPEQTARGFLVDSDGVRWYRTGDIVVQEPGGDYIYRGRRDRMVKRRGYRVELGEIESGLYRHPGVKEAAVVAVTQEEGVQILAFLAASAQGPASLIEMKRFCAEHLPLYMVPDRIKWLPALPKTSTDKIDYQRLKDLA